LTKVNLIRRLNFYWERENQNVSLVYNIEVTYIFAKLCV